VLKNRLFKRVCFAALVLRELAARAQQAVAFVSDY
jgi:hypothetical protein